jgi:hypothetical protein
VELGGRLVNEKVGEWATYYVAEGLETHVWNVVLEHDVVRGLGCSFDAAVGLEEILVVG